MDETFIVPKDILRVTRAMLPAPDTLRKVLLHPRVVEIEEGAFAHYSKLVCVDFAFSSAAIAKSAFFKCASLTHLKDATNVRDIGAWAFFECSALKTVVCSAESVGTRAFDSCSNLKHFQSTKPWSPESYSFFRCFSLVSVENLKSIPDGCFSNCSSLKSFSALPEVRLVGEKAFARCKQLSAVSMRNVQVKEIARDAFVDCSDLRKVHFGASLKVVGAGAFSRCTFLSEVSMPNVRTIKERAFSLCHSLRALAWHTVENIEDSAFEFCRFMISIDLPMVYGLGENVFRGNARLQTVSLPILRKLMKGTFSRCGMLWQVHMPEMRDIGKNCFFECCGLVAWPFMPHLESIRSKAFEQAGLKKVTTAARFIHDYAFSKASGLQELCLQEGNEMIGSAACRFTPLRRMRIPDTTRIIGDLVFSGCPILECITMAEHLPDCGSRSIMPYAFKNVTVEHASGPPKLFRQLALEYQSKPGTQIENFFWSIKRHKEKNLTAEARKVVFTVFCCFLKANMPPEMAMCALQLLKVSALGESV